MSGEGEKRKSARIAAIEAKKSDKSDSSRSNDIPSSVNGQADRRKSIKRKSLTDFARTSISPSAQQVGGGEENNENHSNGNGNLSSGHPLPEKHFLDNALDILQRTDKKDLFARPVDSDVEDYYEVIAEPMDFSTIRTKLRAEVYTTFEEFEHDVLLISENATFFNGENTVYYKQARAIFELSKRVLETLKRDPEKLEQLERDLSQELRRPVQRCRTRRGKPRVYRSLSLNLLSNQAGREINSGSQGHGAKEFISPRESYKPSEFIVSEIFDGPRTLAPGDGSSFGYRNSLMQFVKNLGPVAQRVAAEKLSRLKVAAEKLSRLSSPSRQTSCLQETNLLSSSLSVSRVSSSGNRQGTTLTNKGKNVILDSPFPSADIIQPADRQFLQESINACWPTPVRDHCQIFFNQNGVHCLSEAGTLNVNNHIAGITSGSTHLHNQVLPNQWAQGSRSSPHGAMPTNVRRTSEPSVRPSTYLRPSRFSGTSSSQMNLSPVVEPRRPCGQPMGPYLRLLTMDEGTSDQVAKSAAAAAINMQPLTMIQWGQNKTAAEDLCAPSESISLGMGPARSPYPQRLGLNQPDMDQQAQAAGPSQQVYGQWRSTLPRDPQNRLRQLMPPPGDRSKRPPPSPPHKC